MLTPEQIEEKLRTAQGPKPKKTVDDLNICFSCGTNYERGAKELSTIRQFGMCQPCKIQDDK